MMRSVNWETILTNNQHNQLAVTKKEKKRSETDVVPVEFF